MTSIARPRTPFPPPFEPKRKLGRPPPLDFALGRCQSARAHTPGMTCQNVLRKWAALNSFLQGSSPSSTCW
eukprot:1344342-Alexandrium_andersonii.AAC.1